MVNGEGDPNTSVRDRVLKALYYLSRLEAGERTRLAMTFAYG
jgi:hypothetical protein